MKQNYRYIIIVTIIIILLAIGIHATFGNKEERYTAIIVEPREHKAMEFVMKNFCENLDRRWNFIIFHGDLNGDFMRNIVKNSLDSDSDRIKLVNLHVDNLTIYEYNALFYNKDFYRLIPTEIFLVFQTDTMISKKYKNNIYPFIDKGYDYVGAPLPCGIVGNGGLSLRRKSKMLKILRRCSAETRDDDGKQVPEDVFFSKGCEKKHLTFAPTVEEAKKFSIETFYSPESFGLHKAWKFNDRNTISKMNEDFPGLDTLISLQK